MTWREGQYRIVEHAKRQQGYTLWKGKEVIQFTESEGAAILYAERDRRRRG